MHALIIAKVENIDKVDEDSNYGMESLMREVYWELMLHLELTIAVAVGVDTPCMRNIRHMVQEAI